MPRLALALVLALPAACRVGADHAGPPPGVALRGQPIGGDDAERAQDPVAARLHTDRPHAHGAGPTLLTLPDEDPAFHFVVFGDRTGGPADGVEVLAQAVRDTNLLDPDLVMTVGDLIQGYNSTDRWFEQAAEFKGIMQRLRMPWFPVAGNHDIYWRGDGRPEGEHEAHYEATFGPLWYAFEHKACWFVALYSDEGDPATGRKDFNDPACQRFSDAQFEWLRATLRRARGAPHVFVFLHHPRWLRERYEGSDWDRVHRELVAAGNVTAVFAGHIHRMRYDGERDGIDYYTLATVGGHLEFEAPEAGYLHELHVVTVRPQLRGTDALRLATLPVGGVLDPRLITGQVSEDADVLVERLRPAQVRGLELAADGQALGTLEFELHNPASQPIEVTAAADGDDSWSFAPDHAHARIAPGQRATLRFDARRRGDLGGPITLPEVVLDCDYLGEAVRFRLPTRRLELELPPPARLGVDVAVDDGALRLDGSGDCAAVASAQLALPDGPFTLECWLRGDDFAGRRGLLCKTENSGFGIFVNDAEVDFMVHLDGSYRRAATGRPVLQKGRWHHVAGVFDGREVRAYVDGRRVAGAAAAGARTTNPLPFYVGADPGSRGQPGSFFAGAIDEVRLSRGARYTGERFAPPRRHAADADTVLLLPFDGDAGPWTVDASGRGSHPRLRGDARSVATPR